MIPRLARDWAERRAAARVAAANAAEPPPDWRLPLPERPVDVVRGALRDGATTVLVAGRAAIATWLIGSDEPVSERSGSTGGAALAESAGGAVGPLVSALELPAGGLGA